MGHNYVVIVMDCVQITGVKDKTIATEKNSELSLKVTGITVKIE